MPMMLRFLERFGRLTLGAVAITLALIVSAPSSLYAQSVGKGGAIYDPDGTIRRRGEVYDSSQQERPGHEGFEEDVRGRDEWFYYQRRFPYDRIPAGLRADGVRHVQAIEQRLESGRAKAKDAPRLLSANRWEAIGPINVGGRIEAVALHPTKPGVIYIGAASGGVWKSENGGLSWNTTFDKESSISIGALAIDPVNPDVIFAGTGEEVPHSEEYFGDGMFKSTDAGLTWRNVGLRNVAGFADIRVNSTNGQIVYALGAKSGGGFYRSIDGGESWTLTLALEGRSMSVNPKDPQEILISSTTQIHRSTDGGLTWSNVNTGISSTNVTRISIAFAPSQPSVAYAMVSRISGADEIGDVYYSSNSGQNWTKRARLERYFFNKQGFYDHCIAVHPDSANVVLVGGIDVYRSDNGGNNFANYTEVYSHIDEPLAVHPDQHVLEFDPRDHNSVFVGNDGGLCLSTNAGINWAEISLDLPITQFYKMDVDPYDKDRVYGGSQDNGTSGTLGSGVIKYWNMLSGGDGFFVAVDPIDPNTLYTEIYYGEKIYRINTGTTDRVEIQGDIESQGGDKGDWSSPLVASLADGRLYSGRRNLWRTEDQGLHWVRLAVGFSGGTTSAIGLSNSDGTVLMVGSNRGEGRFSLDDGKTWQTSKGLPGRVISDLRFDPTIPTRVYASVSGFGAGHVFRSDDNGANFTNITANLPDVPINTVCIDPNNNKVLFVGTDAGVFVSLDAGTTWFPFNQGLPLAPVVDLKVSLGPHTLVAATHGRSMFRISIDNVTPEPTLITPIGGELIATPGEVRAAWLGLADPVRVSLSTDGGAHWMVVADNITGSEARFSIGLVRTTTARVQVEEIGSGGGMLTSNYFTLQPSVNGNDLGSRGFIAEAIEVRGEDVWASDRSSDSIFLLKLPLLSQKRALVMSGVAGRVRDMAYDAGSDRFYMLVTKNDFSEAKLFSMDTTGLWGGEIPLPTTSAAGVAIVPDGIAVIGTGPSASLYVIDTAGVVIRGNVPIGSLPDGARRSLCYDGWGLLQGVTLRDTLAPFPTTLERMRLRDTVMADQTTPVILSAKSRVDFYGLAFQQNGSDGPKGLYLATDTAGNFYKFVQENLFSGVDAPWPGGNTGAAASSIVTIDPIVPNPLRTLTSVRFRLERSAEVVLALYGNNGELIATLAHAEFTRGEQSVNLDATSLASGIYYISVVTNSGDRVVTPVVVVR